MAILKSMDHGKTWQPFQYYSPDCRRVFGRRESVPITRANEQEALCVDATVDEDRQGEGVKRSKDKSISPFLEGRRRAFIIREVTLKEWRRRNFL